MHFNSNCLHILLDLEQSLVDSLDRPFRMNTSQRVINQLRSLESTHSAIEFHLFSFAVWNQKDIEIFKSFQPHIEDFFKITFTHIIPIDDVLKKVKNIRRLNVWEESELSQLFGKSDSFIDFCKFHEIDNAILFDDTVDNMEMHIERGNKHINLKTVNVVFQ